MQDYTHRTDHDISVDTSKYSTAAIYEYILLAAVVGSNLSLLYILLLIAGSSTEESRICAERYFCFCGFFFRGTE